MKIEKNYKNYYIKNATMKRQNKIETIKEVLKVNKNNVEDLNNWRTREALTDTQWNYFTKGNLTELKKLLKKQLEKEKTKLIEEKAEAAKKYEDIKALQDIKKLVINITWSSRRLSLGAYQTKASGFVTYKNGETKTFETDYTGGCGYDKPSTSAGQVCNQYAKIILLKHYKKIVESPEKHYKYYAAEGGYFQQGVGIGSYQTLFKNLGYKVSVNYYNNGEDLTLIITK